MAPPKVKKSGRLGLNSKTKKDFDPKSLTEEDRFIYHFSSVEVDRQVGFNFLVFILFMRFFVSIGSQKLFGNKFQKFCLGVDGSYNNPFMGIILCCENQELVEILIYKPKFYNVGFRIGDKWYSVSDFIRCTGRNFPESDELPYESGYRSSCPTHFSFPVFENAVMSIHNSRDRDSFECLCVILCETTRFDSILSTISNSFSSGNSADLDGKQSAMVLNWAHTCIIWHLFVIGLQWDPLGLYPVIQAAGADACSRSLGLLMKPDYNFYIEKVLKLSPPELKRAQRKPMDLKGFMNEVEWAKYTNERVVKI